MTRWLALALLVGSFAVALVGLIDGCDPPYQGSFASGTLISIQGVLESDNIQYDAQTESGSGGQFPSSSDSLSFLATVTAPSGPWTVTVTADGALAVTGAEGSITRAFMSTNAPLGNTTAFPLMIAKPSGTGIVHVTVGPVTTDFKFTIGQPPISLTGAIQTEGNTYDPGGMVPATATNVEFVATVLAPLGPWTISVSADGVFATPGDGVLSRSFTSRSVAGSVKDAGGTQSTDDAAPRDATVTPQPSAPIGGNIFAFPLTIMKPIGTGVVHITVGSVSQDFSFHVGPGQVTIGGIIESGGEFFDASVQGTDAAIGVGAGATTFLATVSTPPGDWTLVVTAEGAFSLAGGAPTASRTFATGALAGDAQLTSTPFGFPIVVVDPLGVGTIHATVGLFEATFTFPLKPVGTVLSLCGVGLDAGCTDAGQAGTTSSQDAGGASANDSGTAYVLSVPTATSGLAVGSRFEIKVSTSRPVDAQSQSWTVHLTTSGSVALVGGDGGVLSSEAVTLAGSSVLVPAMVIGEGLGVISGSTGAGFESQLVVTAGSSAVAVRSVRFLGYAGVLAINTVSVCVQSATGSVSASFPGDAGTLAASTVSIQDPAAAGCPPGYGGSAEFVWTGSLPIVNWAFATGNVAPGPPTPVNMLQTDVCVTVQGASTGSFINVAPPPNSGPGTTTLVNVGFTLARNTPTHPACVDGGLDAGMTPVSYAPFTVIVPPNVSVASTSQTDVNGRAYIELKAPYNTKAIAPSILIQNTVAVAMRASVDGG